MQGPKISLLPTNVANQIAAGEVIERPAAAIKELIENALDAGATRIEITYENGGAKLMRVADNGEGMHPEDAKLAVARHATSKLKTAEDLNNIASFGFRGEALPSIASVSNFKLQTRTHSAETGFELIINAGEEIHSGPCSRSAGTTIEVTDLFKCVPARKKFLKAPRTEAAHIVQLVRTYAVCAPSVAFILKEGTRTVLETNPCPRLRDRIAEIWDAQTAEDLIELPQPSAENNENGGSGLQLTGLIATPSAPTRSTRQACLFAINGRPVDARAFNMAVQEAYRGRLPAHLQNIPGRSKTRYPAAFVFLTMPRSQLDVNVHPAKREVRFVNENTIKQFIVQTLDATLQSTQPATAAFQSAPFSANMPSMQNAPSPAAAAFSGPATPQATDAAARTAEMLAQHATETATLPAAAQMALNPEASGLPTFSGAVGRFIGFMEGMQQRIALFERPAGLLMLGCRSAHMRVEYERIAAELDPEATPPSQQLLLVQTVELEPRPAAVLAAQANYFKGHGLDIEPFGQDTFRVRATPLWLEPTKVTEFIKELGDFLAEAPFDPAQWPARERLAKLAATRALQHTDPLNGAQATDLLERLLRCRTPMHDPIGRLTYWELGANELAKRLDF